MKLLYVCAPLDVFELHPYERQRLVRENIKRINEACFMVEKLRETWIPLAPQLMFGEWLFDPRYKPSAIPNCVELLRRCDGVLLLPKWEYDAQCAAELRVARDMKKPVYNGIGELPG